MNDENLKNQENLSQDDNRYAQLPEEVIVTSSSERLFDTPMPKNHMTLSIVGLVVSILTCGGACFISIVLSVIAVVFSNQVETKYRVGDIIGAEKDAKNAKTLSIISIVISAFALILLVFYVLVIGISSFAALMQN